MYATLLIQENILFQASQVSFGTEKICMKCRQTTLIKHSYEQPNILIGHSYCNISDNNTDL